jgi:hypothetical protein
LVGLSRAFSIGARERRASKGDSYDPCQHLDRGCGCDSPVARCRRPRDDTKGAANSSGKKDIVIVEDETPPSLGQTDDTIKQSAEMGRADVQNGKQQGEAPSFLASWKERG